MKSALQSFARNFKKRKAIYIITLGGFGMALATFILITSFIIEEKSYDKHLPYLNKMYRVRHGEKGVGVPKRYYEQLKENIPEIEKLGMYNRNGFGFKYDNKPHHAQYLGISEDCAELFNIGFVRGNVETLMEAKTGIAVTESYSKKVFGDINPIGEEIVMNAELGLFGNELRINDKRMIVAVVDDPPKTFSIQYDFLWHNDFNSSMSFYCYGKFPDDCYHILETAFVINEKTNIQEVENKLNEALKDCRIYKDDKIRLQKYEEIYFDTSSGWDGHAKANIQIIHLLSVVAIIILILAILNYINLSTAANKERFKEICIRKTSGAASRSIILHFILESYIACIISVILGFILLFFFQSSFKDIFGKEFNVFQSFRHTHLPLVLPAVIFVVGGLAGYFPALTASLHNPVELVQGQHRIKSSGTRGIFNSVQFFVAISLIICLIFLSKQLNYVRTTDFGFDKEYLLSYPLGELDEHVSAIRDKLKEYPYISEVCASEGRPFKLPLSGNTDIRANGKDMDSGHLSFLFSDWNFLKTYNIPLLLGRDFRKTDQNVCLINENFYHEMG